MTIPDKLSDASQQQLAQQLDFFQKFTSRAFENAERILALNIATTRATLDQTSSAVRQFAAARDPRDLLALTAQSQQQVEAAMAYSRKLFEIANQPAVAEPPPEDHIVTAAPVKVSEPVAEPAPSAVAPSAHPMGEADPEPAPAPAIIAKTKPIAKAASKVASAPVDAPHPAASPMPPDGPVDIPAITPAPAKRSGSAAKGSRKR
jgi:phasin family protein